VAATTTETASAGRADPPNDETPRNGIANRSRRHPLHRPDTDGGRALGRRKRRLQTGL